MTVGLYFFLGGRVVRLGGQKVGIFGRTARIHGSTNDAGSDAHKIVATGLSKEEYSCHSPTKLD